MSTAPLAAVLFATSVAAQSSGIRTYCNPIDIDYKYNFEQINEGVSYRSGADPVIINHKGEYFLFVTVSGGYWHSKDLLHWQFVRPSRWPFEDIVAPAAVSVGDTVLLMMSSFSQRPTLYSTEPASGRLEFYNRLLPPLPNYSADSLPGRPGAAGPWDPALFRDSASGRWVSVLGLIQRVPPVRDRARSVTPPGVQGAAPGNWSGCTPISPDGSGSVRTIATRSRPISKALG